MKCLEPLSVKWWWKHFGTTILDPCLHTTVRSANPCRNICPRLSLAASKVGGFQIRLKLSWKSWRTDMLKCRLGPWCYLENFDWISKLESRNFFTSQVANNQSCLKFQKLVFLWSMQSCKACGDRGWHAKVERWECPTARETTGVRTKIWVSTILLVCCLCVLAAEQLCNDPSWFKDQEEAFDEEKRQCRRQILRRKNAFVWLGLVDSERVAIPMHAFSLAELLCISCWQVGRPDSCCSPYPLTGDQMAEGDTHISCVTTYNTCVWFVAACFECSSYPPVQVNALGTLRSMGEVRREEGTWAEGNIPKCGVDLHLSSFFVCHHIMLRISPCKCIETQPTQFCHCSDQPVKTSRPVQDYIPFPIFTSCELVYHKHNEPGSSSYGGIDQHRDNPILKYFHPGTMLWGVKIGQSHWRVLGPLHLLGCIWF